MIKQKRHSNISGFLNAAMRLILNVLFCSFLLQRQHPNEDHAITRQSTESQARKAVDLFMATTLTAIISNWNKQERRQQI